MTVDLDFTIKIVEIKSKSRELRLPALFTTYYKGIPIAVPVHKYIIDPEPLVFINPDAEREMAEVLRQWPNSDPDK